MKVLVTGAYGFLGFNVSRKLLDQGHEVIGVDRIDGAVSKKEHRIHILKQYSNFFAAECDIAQWDSIARVFRDFKPTHVVHLAAQYSVPHRTEVVPNYVNSNCAGFMYVAEAARLARVQRFVYASSTWVSDHDMPWTMYGATKQFNEHAANIYAKQFDMETIGIRYGSAFGPFCRNDVGPYMTAKKLLMRRPIKMQGGFLYKTAFLDIDDAVDCTLVAITAPLQDKWNVVTVVANDQRHDLKEILDYMAAYTGIQPVIDGTYVNQGVGGVPVEQLLKLRATIDFEPQYSDVDTTRKFMEWFVPVFEQGDA